MKRLQDVLDIRSYDGSEAFCNYGEDLGCHLLDYWRWAYSDLFSNTSRGVIAEFIVAKALGLIKKPRNEWAPYDLETNEGKKIEVKSAAYIQRWHQKNHSRISFGIAEKRAWNETTNTLEAEAKRHADIYIFCLFKHKDKDTADILNLDQWEFFVVPITAIEKLGRRKSISLENLKVMNVDPISFNDLASVIKKAK